MKALYLAQIDRQLFAVDKERVIGVSSCNSGFFKPIEEGGRRYLPLPYGNRAMICDVQSLVTGPGGQAPARQGGHYLIVAADEELMALAMTGKGRIVTADVAAARPLPPAFTGPSRMLVPGVLVNGLDLILLLDLQAVLETTVDRQVECRTEEKR
ncbi:MAG: hypothetical protein FWG62_05085 [Proteobacteria bacterium]|nr:hypothetical protein [Pseudomonadota bacterium]